MSWASAGLLDCLPSSGWFSKGSFLITSMPSPPPVSFLEASATEYSCATWYCNGWGQRRRELVMGWLWMAMDGCMSSSGLGLSNRMGHKINRSQQSSSSSYNRLNQLASAGEIRGGRERHWLANWLAIPVPEWKNCKVKRRSQNMPPDKITLEY